VGRPAGDGIEYVLGPFTGREREALPELLARAADAVTAAVEQGVDRAMTEFNKGKLGDSPTPTPPHKGEGD
jgi:PTH1 family peptidyl-tRNA hydrolase